MRIQLKEFCYGEEKKIVFSEVIAENTNSFCSAMNLVGVELSLIK